MFLFFIASHLKEIINTLKTCPQFRVFVKKWHNMIHIHTYCQSHLQKLVPPSSGQRLVLTDFTCTNLFKVNKNKSDLIAHIMS